MRERIKVLEKTARLLEPSAGRRDQVTEAITGSARSFLATLDERPACGKKDTGHPRSYRYMPRETPRTLRQVLSVLEEDLFSPGLNPASAGYLGYIPGGGLYHAALGDFLAAVTNRFATVFYASPGAVRMENMLIRWMCRLVGYPPGSFGYLSSGGSMANLSAVIAARDAKNLRSKQVPESVVYYTAQAHHCIDKALRMAGLAECIRRLVPMDGRYRMDVSELKAFVEQDRQKGLRPWLVIASAGTTDTGAVDPLDDIAQVARKYDLWYHVDAAYGGFFLLTPKGKRKMKGIAAADSIVMDPHKGLFIPYGSGTLLVKNKEDLFRSFHYQAGYMQDTLHWDEEISPSEVSPELSRHFRGLRLWLPLQLHGLKPFRAALEEKMLLSAYFYREVKALGFETGPAPELSVVIYRFVPKRLKGDRRKVNAFNEAVLKAVQADGRIFISSTTIDGVYWLRLAVLSFRTHLKHVDLLLKILKDELQNLM